MNCTIREYFYNRFRTTAFKGKSQQYRSRFICALNLLEDHFHHNSERLNVSRLSEADIKAMKVAMLDLGYELRTARNYTEAIRAILRHARPSDFPITNAPIATPYPQYVPEYVNERPHPDTWLLVYLRHYFFLNGIGTRSYERSLWIAIEKLSESLGEPARLRHLNDEAITDMLKLCEQQGLRQATISRYRLCIRALWRRAVSQGLVAHGKVSVRSRSPGSGAMMQTVPVTGEEGGLWWWCLNRFFPINTRIAKVATKHQYHFAMRSFKTFLGHEPGLDDLTDDTVTAWMVSLRDQGKLQHVTINERVGRVITLWTWLAKKKIVEQFPFVPRLKEPKRAPRCWTLEELGRILVAAQQARGRIGTFKASDFWPALLLTLFDSAARISEVMEAKWSWLDWDRGFLSIPAEARKGGERDMVYKLHPETLDALNRILPVPASTRDKIFTWPFYERSLWKKYGLIVKAAGLPYDRTCAFHKIRRTVASYLEAAGHSACSMLQHSSPSVTIESYLDPSIVNVSRPCDILPRLGGKDGAI